MCNETANGEPEAWGRGHSPGTPGFQARVSQGWGQRVAVKGLRPTSARFARVQQPFPQVLMEWASPEGVIYIFLFFLNVMSRGKGKLTFKIKTCFVNS